MTAAELVRALNGRGDSAPCPVPGHGRGRGDRNFSLSVHDGADGRILAKCHGGCPQADVWASLRGRGLIPATVDCVGGRPGPITEELEKARFELTASRVTDRRAAALGIWEASIPALNSPAQAYLQARGIVLRPPPCIRFHAGKSALVALIQAPDGTFSGIQRIFLATDSLGTWKRPIEKPKKSLGPVKGGAVRLTSAAESLQLTESVEDGLALLQMTGKATWAVPGAGFMVDFEPPPEVREVILTPDRDAAGIEAIERAAAKNKDARAGVIVCRQLLPPPGLDWCDVLENFDERIAIQEENLAAPPKSWVEAFCDG